MDLKEIERLVAKIQSRLFKNSNSYSVGMLKSQFRGTGLQFKEHQVYCHGDDVRFIDWKLYAKTNTPHVKIFEEERNVEIVIFIDMALSMFMGYKGVSKIQAALNISFLLSLLTRESGDYVKFVLLCDEEIILNKSNGRNAIALLVRVLKRNGIICDDGKINFLYRPQKTISKKEKMALLNRFIKRRKEVVILSDFNDFVDESDLNYLSKLRTVHCFRIVSPLDKNQSSSFKFNIFGFNSSKFPEKDSQVVNLKDGEDNHFASLGNRIKQIDIESSYMEDFVGSFVR